MIFDLNENKIAYKKTCREFVRSKIIPLATKYEKQGRLPKELILEIASRGYLGSFLSKEYGGEARDLICYGILNEEFGLGSSSVRSLLTVHDMVVYSILKFGTEIQKKHWFPGLLSGEKIAAFCLSEEESGSDAKSIKTHAELSGNEYKLNGRKKWITFGQIADLFLVFALVENTPTVFLVGSNSPGVKIIPIKGIMGVDASMLAEIEFKDVIVKTENILGKIGNGFRFIMPSALALGRYSVACGCLGIIRGCLETSLNYIQRRKQFGKLLNEFQLIKKMISEMAVNYKAARLLCLNAGYLLEKNDPKSVTEIISAKYFASKAAVKASSDAVQIHGALGCSSDSQVQQFYRDSKIMEIIEGSSQILEILIANNVVSEFSVGD
jgi:alkylation response protein AidB-like acyl-CoA dehydrogenase